MFTNNNYLHIDKIMNYSNKEKRIENQKRHEAFRLYYWRKQTSAIYNISICFLIFCAICFFAVVPFEHSGYPELGRLKYGISVIGHLVFACFSKWLLETKRFSDEKKASISELFTFILGLAYLIWGLLGMEIAIIEYKNPVILMYLILLAVITAFLYYRTRHFVLLIIISYSLATVCFLTHREVPLDMTSAICAVTMMIILGVLSNTRYVFGRDRFEFEAQNISLLKEQEMQNEELEAQNEELIAINQELNDTTEKLGNALKDLEEVSNSQKLFTNSMNHELRAPLNGIIGTIQVMLMNEQRDNTDRNYLLQCMAMSKSLLNIVNDLLDYAKMDAGEFEIFPSPFDLHEVINNIDGTFKNTAENKGLKLIFDIADDTICGLYGDDFRIQQIIANIVSNGIKYTEKGSVTVNVSYMNDTLKFVISDTGQGISEESMKDLFTPFKRISESKNKKIQGTGLGMSIVKNLINKMGGAIDVKSKLGEGSIFTVSIPSKVTNENNTWGSPVKTGSSSDIENIDFEGKHILYVDDTSVNLKIITKLLSDTNAQITTTDSPFEGLKLAKENHYDIIMVDHQMPDMSGPELMKTIKSESYVNSDTPMIIFTGNAGTGIEEMYQNMGFSGFISKPVMKNDLIEAIKKVFNL